MTVRELHALWVGVQPKHIRVNQQGLISLGRLRYTGARIHIPGTDLNIQRVSRDHEVIGYGHIELQVPMDRPLKINTTDFEERRLQVKKTLAEIGIFGPVDIVVTRVTPMDGKDVHD